MPDSRIRLLFNPKELLAMKRCTACGWSPREQSHHPDCPQEKP
jgi:hypothetical protein